MPNFHVSTDFASKPDPPGTPTSLRGSWTGAGDGGCQAVHVGFHWGYVDAGENSTNELFFESANGSYATSVPIGLDRVFVFEAHGYDECQARFSHGSTIQDKSKASAATAGTPTASNVQSNSATIACTHSPNVVDSTFQVTMQYRKLGDSTWITAGAAQTTGTSISRNISGLLGSTTYQFKMVGTRTTVNLQGWESSVQSFTTLADAPTIQTDPATVVTSTQARLNGTVDPNGVSGVEVRFGWGTADGGATLGSWQNQTAPQAKSGTEPVGFEQLVSGLSPSSTYHYRAFVGWNGEWP